MNKNKLKTYTQTARREFIEAVTERAHYYGLKENSIIPCEVKGDFAIINGRDFPKQVDEQRSALEEQVNRKGFAQVMEEIAYTWFNRFAAIRYMELHGFLSHGYRVLSHPSDSSVPEILEKAQYVELAGLDKEEVIKLKMEGTKDEELYCKLLIAECNELSKIMPFLFEHVADYTELLLPDNLLHSDSLIRKMVSEIVEEDWQEIEIIGWLYQFYISEKKDAVIGKVVKSEDIPAATQLFTPNWIVKYLVQNSLGAQWMRTYPDSKLKNKMEYYIEPAKQTDEVNAKIKEITPETLNPEELTLLDPACGSGHILVEAYDLLKEIYLERGYRRRDIPELILTKNLFGLEIDDRATQLAGFAVMMKARGDDRSIFDKNIQPNIVSIQESSGIRAENEFVDLVNLFEHAKTFGSLIRVPDELAGKLPKIRKELESKKDDLDKQDIWTQTQKYEDMIVLVNQAEMLTREYDAVVANPPYMGSKGMNCLLKDFAKHDYPHTKSDLFAMFIERGFELSKQDSGSNAMVTMQSWMFLSSYETMRKNIISNTSVRVMVHMANGVMGIAFGTAATVWFNLSMLNYKGSFSYVDYSNLNEKNVPCEFPIKNDRLKNASSGDFKGIPGSPIAYWASREIFEIFQNNKTLNCFSNVKRGMTTSNNDLFLRFWPEVSESKSCRSAINSEDALSSKAKWFPYSKGGGYRKWYGYNEFYVNWENNGNEVIQFAKTINKSFTRTIVNISYYFRPSIGFSYITNGPFSMRWLPEGFIYDSGGPGVFCNEKMRILILGCMNSKPALLLLKLLNPTINLQIADVVRLPIPDLKKIEKGTNDLIENIRENIQLSRKDWDFLETSWDFKKFPMFTDALKGATVKDSYSNWERKCNDNTARMKELEEENNRIFIEAYGLQDELTSDVPDEEITLFTNPKYRYGTNYSEEDLGKRLREGTIKELISYAVGCMMGRYSLDMPGLVYAHAGNDGFDPSKYTIFPADADGIVPITDTEWFDDDAACRFFRFIETGWDKDTLEDNLEFITEAIGRKTNESSRDSIRRYFVNGFYKDHLKTYKKRPIYWLFTSGKEKAFQALVYLHRYNEGTLSRMRTEYVLPLQSKMTTRMEHLKEDKDHATSTSAANKIQKEINNLRKQKEELLKFDENLHHYADKKISLDLDDGVKVNYGKFGDLLAEVKAVTGRK